MDILEVIYYLIDCFLDPPSPSSCLVVFLEVLFLFLYITPIKWMAKGTKDEFSQSMSLFLFPSLFKTVACCQHCCLAIWQLWQLLFGSLEDLREVTDKEINEAYRWNKYIKNTWRVNLSSLCFPVLGPCLHSYIVLHITYYPYCCQACTHLMVKIYISALFRNKSVSFIIICRLRM